MSCPYYRELNKPRCGVFDNKYQPCPRELETYCKTSDFVECKIYHFYFTTFAKSTKSEFYTSDCREGFEQA